MKNDIFNSLSDGISGVTNYGNLTSQASSIINLQNSIGNTLRGISIGGPIEGSEMFTGNDISSSEDFNANTEDVGSVVASTQSYIDKTQNLITATQNQIATNEAQIAANEAQIAVDQAVPETICVGTDEKGNPMYEHNPAYDAAQAEIAALTAQNAMLTADNEELREALTEMNSSLEKAQDFFSRIKTIYTQMGGVSLGLGSLFAGDIVTILDGQVWKTLSGESLGQDEGRVFVNLFGEKRVFVQRANPDTGKTVWVLQNSDKAQNWKSPFGATAATSSSGAFSAVNTKLEYNSDGSISYVNGKGEVVTLIKQENPDTGKDEWVVKDSKNTGTESKQKENDEKTTDKQKEDSQKTDKQKDDSQKTDKQKDDSQKTDKQKDVSVSSSSGGKVQLQGNTNYEKAYNYLKDKGYNDAATSGILANFYSESYNIGDFNPKTIGDGGLSHGIAQWHDGAYGDNRMINWCSSNGYDSESMEGQLAYFTYDLQNNYPDLDAQLRNTDNSLSGALSAGSKVGIIYERPANEWGASGRGNISKYIMHQLSDGATIDEAITTIESAKKNGQLY